MMGKNMQVPAARSVGRVGPRRRGRERRGLESARTTDLRRCANRGMSLTDDACVTRIVVMTTQSLAAVKAHFSQVIDEVAGTHERVIVTKNGSPVAVILAVEDYESLMETLEILSDPHAVAEIRDAEARMNEGEAFDQEDIRATLAARRG